MDSEDGQDGEMYEEEARQKVLFNDVFGTRADYSKGLFYEIRRRYLTDGNSLQPPEDFMKPVGVCSNDTREDIILRTRSSFKMPMRPQDSPSHSAHPSHRLSSANKTEKFYQYLQFNNKNWEEKEAAALLKAQYRRMEAAKKSKPSQRKLLLQRYSSTNPDDWHEQMQAGCKIWLNRSTGEVSAVCPWTDEDDDVPFVKGFGRDLHGEEHGTGALVYDDQDVKDLFRMLDASSSRRDVLEESNRK